MESGFVKNEYMRNGPRPILDPVNNFHNGYTVDCIIGTPDVNTTKPPAGIQRGLKSGASATPDELFVAEIFDIPLKNAVGDNLSSGLHFAS